MNPRLKSLAYRMLGSVADAEDVVQEAELRLHAADPQPDSAEGFLVRTVSNLSIDRLRRLQTERAQYVGPWLPEPLVDDETLGAEQAEGLSLGFLMLLEALSPAERIVYVLKEAFDFSFVEIADVLEISAASARQRGHRARRKLRDHKPPAAVPRADQEALLSRLVATMASGDIDGLTALLHDDAVAYTDGGGVVSAALIPVTGLARIAQVGVHLMKKVAQLDDVAMHFAEVNGDCALVVTAEGSPYACITLGLHEHLVQSIYVIRNPEKLTRINKSPNAR